MGLSVGRAEAARESERKDKGIARLESRAAKWHDLLSDAINEPGPQSACVERCRRYRSAGGNSRSKDHVACLVILLHLPCVKHVGILEDHPASPEEAEPDHRGESTLVTTFGGRALIISWVFA